MRTRVIWTLVVGLLVVGALGGCATRTASPEGFLPNAQNPEYFIHPFRVFALGGHFAGNVLQYGLVEPFYFLMASVPDAVGLSLDEQRYLAERQEAWKQYLESQRLIGR